MILLSSNITSGMESKDSVRMVIGLVLISISVCGELLTVYGLLGDESSDFLRSNF